MSCKINGKVFSFSLFEYVFKKGKLPTKSQTTSKCYFFKNWIFQLAERRILVLQVNARSWQFLTSPFVIFCCQNCRFTLLRQIKLWLQNQLQHAKQDTSRRKTWHKTWCLESFVPRTLGCLNGRRMVQWLVTARLEKELRAETCPQLASSICVALISFFFLKWQGSKRGSQPGQLFAIWVYRRKKMITGLYDELVAVKFRPINWWMERTSYYRWDGRRGDLIKTSNKSTNKTQLLRFPSWILFLPLGYTLRFNWRDSWRCCSQVKSIKSIICNQ